MAAATSELEELVRLRERYQTRGRPVSEMRWYEAHLAEWAVVAETASSVYVFVPVYAGRQYVGLPGGTFRFAGFDASNSVPPPRILFGRPHDATVGQPLEIGLARDRRRQADGVSIGSIVIDDVRPVTTSPLQAMFVMPLE